jgi:beta-RFAP synthase
MSETISITTGARLHFGPLAVGAAAGRQFGGVGVMVDRPACVVAVSRAERDEFLGGTETARLEQAVEHYRRHVPRGHPPCRVELREPLPRHAGFGSGTQLALAVARGLSLVSGEAGVSAVELAQRVGRGRRSAVGIHGFERGGLIVDAGKSSPGAIGELACRAALPETWRCLLITPPSAPGASGAGEQSAFERLPPMPVATTDRLCAIALRELLPAVHAGDFADFSAALLEFGCRVGEYFWPVQGGVFAGPRTERLVERARAYGVTGVAQTSWGPTICCWCPDAPAADRLERLIAEDRQWSDCVCRIAAPLNQGAAVSP